MSGYGWLRIWNSESNILHASEREPDRNEVIHAHTACGMLTNLVQPEDVLRPIHPKDSARCKTCCKRTATPYGYGNPLYEVR